MRPASESPNELRRLRERVYGRDAEVSAADIARLAELEAAESDRAIETTEVPEAAAGRDSPVAAATELEPAPPARGMPWRTVVATVCVAVIVGGAAFAAGAWVAAPAAPDDYPELLLPQTEEDIVAISPSDPLTEKVELSSTRFIARLDDIDIFIARPADSTGVCVLTRIASAQVFTGAGCSEGERGRARVGYGMIGGLQIFVGEPVGRIAGDRIQLSESVTVFVS